MEPANANAWPRVTFPIGNGRRDVRFISLSLATSYTWLRVFAAAAQQKVPAEVHPAFAQSTFSPLPETVTAHNRRWMEEQLERGTSPLHLTHIRVFLCPPIGVVKRRGGSQTAAHDRKHHQSFNKQDTA
jgi:hypothetical protein